MATLPASGGLNFIGGQNYADKFNFFVPDDRAYMCDTASVNSTFNDKAS